MVDLLLSMKNEREEELQTSIKQEARVWLKGGFYSETGNMI